MSYDIYLIEPTTKETIEFELNHEIKGGTYRAGGSNEAHLNITWNYGQIFRQVLGKQGIRTIYGMTGAESIPVLRDAIDSLADELDLIKPIKKLKTIAVIKG